MPAPSPEVTLWPFLVYGGLSVAVVGAMLLISHALGERGRGQARDEPYESGILPAGPARLRLSAKFYLLAMFFVIFDLETVFVVTWAVAARELGWRGYGAIALFIGLLLVALIYLWRQGALDWGPMQKQRQIRRRLEKQRQTLS